MKVQTKITLLLALVVALFIGGVLAFRYYNREKFRRVDEERLNERNRAFDEFLERDGEALNTLVEYDSCWDQMVAAIASSNSQWFAENVNSSVLEGYRAQAIWVCRPDGTVVYPLNDLGATDLRELPIPREAFAKIFARDQLCHFFIKVPQGVMEIRGATVHPSKDFNRETPPRGYFFAGRLWNAPALEEKSIFSGNSIRLAPADAKVADLKSEEQNGSIVFSRVLKSWDDKPVAQLIIKNELPVVRELNSYSEELIGSLVLFALVLFLLISTSLLLWVTRPLRQIMDGLRRNDPKRIEALSRQRSEFGELARTIEQFFAQRDNLIREMEERRATEEALRKSEEALRHSQKMEAVGRLAGGIAHDFNNLLTAIIGYAELVANRSKNDGVVRQNADLIRKAGEQAAGLTRQLLAFSRKQLLQPKVIDLNVLVLEMEKLLRRVIGERFELQTIREAKDGRVRADASQLEQVIINLGVNARDAMPTGGRLIIRTSNVHLDESAASQIAASISPGDYVVLAVTDTGAGMDAETKSRIFEPFFTTKGPGKGTGLGLATVYGIVRQSGGGISVESAPGKGSTFRIYLPLERAPLEHVKAPALPLEPSENFETILVVEDEQIVRDLVCEVLDDQGYRILCAADGNEALRMAADFPEQINLLITDVIMPQMNGQELAEKLLRARPGLKVLFVSGYSDNDISDHGVLDSRIELLEKPFTPQALARKVREVLEENYARPVST